MVKQYFGFQIRSVQSDNGGEFQHLKTVLHSMVVSYRLSCPHTHHQNGTMERKHSHLVEMGLALLAHASVPLNFWDEVFESYPPRLHPTNHLMKFSSNHLLIMHFSKFMSVNAGHFYGLTIAINLHSDLNPAYSLVIANNILVINAFISHLVGYT
jgi:hypothetical protein